MSNPRHLDGCDDDAGPRSSSQSEWYWQPGWSLPGPSSAPPGIDWMPPEPHYPWGSWRQQQHPGGNLQQLVEESVQRAIQAALPTLSGTRAATLSGPSEDPPPRVTGPVPPAASGTSLELAGSSLTSTSSAVGVSATPTPSASCALTSSSSSAGQLPGESVLLFVLLSRESFPVMATRPFSGLRATTIVATVASPYPSCIADIMAALPCYMAATAVLPHSFCLSIAALPQTVCLATAVFATAILPLSCGLAIAVWAIVIRSLSCCLAIAVFTTAVCPAVLPRSYGLPLLYFASVMLPCHCCIAGAVLAHSRVKRA